LQVYDSVKNDSVFKRLYNAVASAGDRVQTYVQSRSPQSRQKLAARKTSDALTLTSERQSLCREGSLHENTGVPSGPYDKMMQWKLELKLLQLFDEKCHSDHCKFVVASFFAAEEPKLSRDTFAQHLLTIKEQAPQLGFQYVDLTPSIENAPEKKTRPLFLSAHLSPRGHEIVSKTLTDSVEW
jgi:hypothetical protein